MTPAPIERRVTPLVLIGLLGCLVPGAHGLNGKRRTVMTYLVGHSSDFPALAKKTADLDGAITSAAPICSNPGHMPSGGMNLTSLYCLDAFLEPLRNASKSAELLPMVQMANEVLQYNMEHFGWTVRTYKQAALKWDDYIDGYLFYPQMASKVGHEGDYKALAQLLDLWADEMHSINKTLGVFVPDYHSKFSPAAVLDSTHIDFWVTNLEVKTCSEVSDFYWGLHGKGLKKGGGTLFTSDGEFNSESCMESLFNPVNGSLSKSNATTMAFYSDFSSMGDVWWPALKSWVDV
eukprot:m.458552 g.458552  ORF g.458552 m.458552 type:complete len:291 (-) comp21527_c0_seq1:200-1072(-)